MVLILVIQLVMIGKNFVNNYSFISLLFKFYIFLLFEFLNFIIMIIIIIIIIIIICKRIVSIRYVVIKTKCHLESNEKLSGNASVKKLQGVIIIIYIYIYIYIIEMEK